LVNRTLKNNQNYLLFLLKKILIKIQPCVTFQPSLKDRFRSEL